MHPSQFFFDFAVVSVHPVDLISFGERRASELGILELYLVAFFDRFYVFRATYFFGVQSKSSSLQMREMKWFWGAHRLKKKKLWPIVISVRPPSVSPNSDLLLFHAAFTTYQCLHPPQAHTLLDVVLLTVSSAELTAIKG